MKAVNKLAVLLSLGSLVPFAATERGRDDVMARLGAEVLGGLSRPARV